MVERDGALLAGRSAEGFVRHVPAVHHNQPALLAGHQHLDGLVAELRAQDAVFGNGCAAALDVAEHGVAAYNE